MDHAEAHERIADLVLEPRALAAFETDPAPEAAALREHVGRCAVCRSELDGWRRTHDLVLTALEDAGLDEPALAASLGEAPLGAPSSLRASVAAIPRSVPRTAGPVPTGPVATRTRRWVGWTRLPPVAAAALLLVAVATATFAFGQAQRADVIERQATRLETLSTSMDRLLRDPDHASTILFAADGTPAGTATWTSDEIVMLTTALERPPEGFEYRCWIERNGARHKIGTMWLGDDIAYWWGELDSANWSAEEGGRIGISLEPKEGPGGNTPLIQGELPG